jgi:DNA-binding XRE family transcriptional regulator
VPDDIPTETTPSSQRSKLAELRVAADLTREQLAREAGISRDTLARAEGNIGTIRLSSAQAIAAALGRTVDEVFS